jgi:hypothetical protein
MLQAAVSFIGYIALLVIGSALFVFGLLHAAHPPFQRWWYNTRWFNPDRKGPIDISSDEYKNAIAHMKIAGSRSAVAGGLMMIFALSQLGGETLIMVVGILFVAGLLLYGLVRLIKAIFHF